MTEYMNAQDSTLINVSTGGQDDVYNLWHWCV